MGMTYAELSEFGRLRKMQNCGPFSMFQKLVHTWSDKCTPQEVSSHRNSHRLSVICTNLYKGVRKNNKINLRDKTKSRGMLKWESIL